MDTLELVNWNDAIRHFSREELELFAIHAIGSLMACKPYTDKTPQEVFEMIYEKVSKCK